MEALKKLQKFLDSEEGQKSIADYAEKLNRENEIKTKQLERFNSRGNLQNLQRK